MLNMTYYSLEEVIRISLEIYTSGTARSVRFNEDTVDRCKERSGKAVVEQFKEEFETNLISLLYSKVYEFKTQDDIDRLVTFLKSITSD